MGTSQKQHKITAIELHGLAEVFQTETHNKMTTRQDDSSRGDVKAQCLSAQSGADGFREHGVQPS